MTLPQGKVDLAEMNAAIDKVLAFSPAAKSEQKKQRTHHKAGHPPTGKAGKNTAQTAAG